MTEVESVDFINHFELYIYVLAALLASILYKTIQLLEHMDHIMAGA